MEEKKTKEEIDQQVFGQLLNDFINNELIGVPEIVDKLSDYAAAHAIDTDRATIDSLVRGLIDMGYVIDTKEEREELSNKLRKVSGHNNKQQTSVFISYSRKDIEKARAIKAEIEKHTNCQCWMDMEGIESGDQFEDVIIKALNKCKFIVFVLSANSMRSVYAQKEVKYAYGKKKKLIPVQIDDAELTDWFLFNFSGIDIIDYKQTDQKNKLFNNLKAWSSGDGTTETASTSGNGPQELSGNANVDTIGGNDSGCYDLLQNAAGEIMVVINKQPGEPENPRFVYDGEDRMLFYMSRSHAQMLKNIAPEARKPLMEVEEILVVEIENDDVAREYKVPMRVIKKLDLI